MAKTRIVARWLVEFGVDPETGDGDKDRHVYKDSERTFKTAAEAVKYASERDLFQEGTAVVQELHHYGSGRYRTSEWVDIDRLMVWDV